MIRKDDYEARANGCYNNENKLVKYPSNRLVRDVVIKRFANLFEIEREYNEKEVNDIIKANMAYSDHELIRRELIENKLLARTPDCRKYWKVN